MAPVTPGQARVQATATAETVVPWRAAMGRRASRKAMLRPSSGSLKLPERRRQSSAAMRATRSAEKPSVRIPDCIGL